MVQINLATSMSIAALASVTIVNALPVAPQAGSFEIVERGVTDPELAARSRLSFLKKFIPTLRIGAREIDVDPLAARGEDPELTARFGFLKKFIPFLGGRDLDMDNYVNDLIARGEDPELAARRFGFLKKFIPFLGGRELEDYVNDLAARNDDPELAARFKFGFLKKFIPFLGGRDLEVYVNDLAARNEDPELAARFGFLKKFIPFLGGRELGMSDDLEVRGSELEEIEDFLSRFYDEGSLDEMD